MKYIVIACYTAILSTALPGCNKHYDRPNIIFLCTDDQRDNTFGIDGQNPVKTPNLNKLIHEGVRFANTYAADPVCCPSRVSLFTGLHARKHLINFTSVYQLTEDQWQHSYPAELRSAGYHTGFIGKFGVEYYSFRGRADTAFDYWRAHDGWTSFFPKDYENSSCKPYHSARENVITFIMGEYIEDFLLTRPKEKPFCLSVSFSAPHLTQCAGMHPDTDKPRQMLEPANNNPRLRGHPLYDTLYRHCYIPLPEGCCTDPYSYIPRFILDQDRGRKQTYIQSYAPETNREHHIRYYQLISGVDSVIGNMRRSLAEKGLDKNTIIIYSSDNGLLMGDYGMGGKSLLYDYTCKVPTFIYDPSLPRKLRGRRSELLTSTLDLPVTILE